VLPAAFPSRLPAAAERSTIRIAHVGGSLLRSGGARRVVVAVTHNGTSGPWPSRLSFVGGLGWVRLAVVWVPSSGSTAPVAQQSADLPGMVFPGETVDSIIALRAIGDDGRPLPPGEYLVRIGLVQDGFSFFADKGDQTLDVAVKVAR
ncbi:MAG TPA: hypothetical protein VGA62_09865, partial [Acidimicrobiia bacterium]